MDLQTLHKLTIVFRVVWPLSNAILFLRMATDWKENPIMRLGGTQIMKSCSKLYFALSFVHMEVLYIILLKWAGSLEVDGYHIVTTFLFTYTLSTLISAGLYILVEDPINRLISVYVLKRAVDKSIDSTNKVDKKD